MGKYFLESLNEANIDPNEASTYRLERWSTGIKFFLLNPVFGLGLNGYRYMGIQKGYIGEAAHNSYIHSLTVSGIIGGIIFLYFIKTIYKAIKYKNNGYESIFIKSIKVALLSFLTGYITSAFFSDHFFNFNYLNIILFGITSIYLNIRYT